MQLISTHAVKTADLGLHGNLFGGYLLQWLDNAGAVYAMEVCGTFNMVTVSIDQCIFKKPAKAGDLVKIYGEVVSIGTTSIRVNLEARNHNVNTGQQKTILSTSATFVRIDNIGDPAPINPVVRAKYNTKNT